VVFVVFVTFVNYAWRVSEADLHPNIMSAIIAGSAPQVVKLTLGVC